MISFMELWLQVALSTFGFWNFNKRALEYKIPLHLMNVNHPALHLSLHPTLMNPWISGVECYSLCKMQSPFNCGSYSFCLSKFVVKSLLNGGSIRGWVVNGGLHLDFLSLCWVLTLKVLHAFWRKTASKVTPVKSSLKLS